MTPAHPEPTAMRMSRREFLTLAASAGVAAATGCAVNPVTGKSEFMLVSEEMEIDLDRQWSPHQFSSDYGAVQDRELNRYLTGLGTSLAPFTHRPAMPYTFRALNTPVVNAYTFPGGSMGFARGLFLSLKNEAELAAVMGHEMGHVAARHAAQQQTSGMITELILTGVVAYVDYEFKDYSLLAAGLGALGAFALLSRYSRDNEREADKLGMLYACRAGYDPNGMVGVMDAFRQLQKESPGAIDLLFATHPMSQERYDTALKRAQTEYAAVASRKQNIERYMDRTSGLRKIRPAIESMQKGEELMVKDKHVQAETELQNALKAAPNDYAALLIMSKCQFLQKKYAAAQSYADQARRVYPDEPQALHVAGMVKMNARRYDAALQDFIAYETRLPGNPNTMFFRGYCLDEMGNRPDAATEYERYLEADPQGEYSQKVRTRLIQWGRLQPEPKPSQPTQGKAPGKAKTPAKPPASTNKKK